MTIENLRSTSFDLFSFFEMTPDLVCIASKDGFFKNVNPAVINTLGYSESELFASPISSFVHPDDRARTSATRTNMLEGNALRNFQNRYLAKNRKLVWLEWTSIYLPDKELVFAIAKDITAKKLIETEIKEQHAKFKNLASHFKSSLESDRKFLADELHEKLAQLVSAIRIDLDEIISTTEFSGASKQRLEHARATSDVLIDTLRKISFSFSPGMLDDLGLDATITWYCSEFSSINHISCQFESHYEESDLSSEARIDFFRICQESLANVMHHAQATEVIVRIEEIDEHIHLAIVDNGIGFNPRQPNKNSGLLTMRERAASINGNFTIKSEPGKGTTVSVVIRK